MNEKSSICIKMCLLYIKYLILLKKKSHLIMRTCYFLLMPIFAHACFQAFSVMECSGAVFCHLPPPTVSLGG